MSRLHIVAMTIGMRINHFNELAAAAAAATAAAAPTATAAAATREDDC